MRCGAAHQLVGNHELRCALHDKALPSWWWLAVLRHPRRGGKWEGRARDKRVFLLSKFGIICDMWEAHHGNATDVTHTSAGASARSFGNRVFLYGKDNSTRKGGTVQRGLPREAFEQNEVDGYRTGRP